MQRRSFLSGATALTAVKKWSEPSMGPSVSRPRGDGPRLSLDEMARPGMTDWQLLTAALEECRRRRVSRLMLPQRTYHLDDPKVLDRPGAHLQPAGLRDLVIDGQGSELIFHHIRAGFKFRECQRVELRNLIIDWDIDLASLGTVAREPSGVLSIRIANEFPVNERTPVQAIAEYEVEARRWKMDGAELYYPKQLCWIRPQTFTTPSLPGGGRRRAFREGMQVVVRHYVYEAHAFDFGGKGNADLTFDRITVYRCPGHTWVGYGCDRGFRVSNCNIMRRPGSSHPITATADGAHFGATYGDIIVEDCDFTLQGDDSINIHGAWLRVRQGSGKREIYLTSRLLRPELVEPGCELSFHRAANLAEYGTARVEACEIEPAQKRFRVTLNRLPEGSLADGDYVANLSRASNRFVIRNNHFHDHRARGMLIQARDGRIEKNRILNTQAAALQITTDANYWQEGYGCRNLVARGNTIVGCNYAVWERGASGRHMACVNILADTLTGLGDYPVHSNIRFEENEIRDTPGLAILVASARAVTVRGNRIADANRQPFENTGEAIDAKAAGTIMVTRAFDVEVTGNRITSTGTVFDSGIHVDERNTRNVTVKDNTAGRKHVNT